MALIVRAELLIQGPMDQVPIANVSVGDVTLNPGGADAQIEMDLAMAALDQMIEIARERAEGKLKDWVHVMEAAERQANGDG